MRSKFIFFLGRLSKPSRRILSTSSPTRGLRMASGRLLGFTFFAACSAGLLLNQMSILAKEELVADVKVYSVDEIAQHTTLESGVWVSFRGNVYDITNYVRTHPGGLQAIVLAAGKDLEPFWALYPSHIVTNNARNILERYRIGKLAALPSDGKPVEKVVPAGNPAYANDPVRHPALKPFIKQPFIAEPPSPLLTSTYNTPADVWFVVNHLPVPDLSAKDHVIQIKGEGIHRPIDIPLAALKSKFKVHKIAAAIQCGGNRRIEMSEVKPTIGIQWGPGSICNAEFTGVLLRDVLKYAGFNVEDVYSVPNAQHVQFEGLDTVDGKKYYGASIPVEKAVSAEGDVLLAWEMNGEPLTRDHGYPLRVVVPGHCAVRSVKWVKNIIVSKEENESFWQRVDYKAPPPYMTPENVDWTKVPAIQSLPVTSAVTEPQNNSAVNTPTVPLKGYAYSGDGHGIHRVDITTDDGVTWSPATLLPHVPLNPSDPPQPQRYRRAWAWTQWKAEIPTKPGTFRVCAKATDDSGNTQPEGYAGTWNFKGYNVSSWACVKLNGAKGTSA